MKLGAVAGRINRLGYRQIKINGKYHSASRLAWFYVHGEWPESQIDHINRIRDDNRLCNLRCVTHRENCLNRTYAKSVMRGTVRKRNRWQAQISINNKTTYLGLFPTREEASAAYFIAVKKHEQESR
jgi:hypothetical protein